jgi:membrane peptidoglycan carboxypeptidase
MLERGGLKIITTLDVDLQRQLNCTLQAQLTRLAGGSSSVASCPAAELLPPLPLSAPLPEAAAQLSASAALLDPTGGQVLALVGDTSLTAGESPQKTHPSGSVQTPFLALVAFARGMSPASLVWDLPPGETETPTTTADYHGPVRLRTALANDYLAALTQVLEQIGVDTLITTERQLAISTARLPVEGKNVLHGGAELTPLDVAFAYSVFSTLGQQTGWLAPDGEGMFPQVVLAVENSAGDRVDIDLQTETRAVVSPQLAYLVHHVLADEPARRPSLGYPNPLEIGRPAGAKAGSADSGRSTWAAGYTRQAAGAVWLGYADDAQTPAAPLDVNFAAGIWQAMMQYASRDQPVLGWEMPPGLVSLEVCDPSGLLPTIDCPNVVPELFLAENLPTATDTLYRRYAINRETGRLATVFTPPELVDEAVFLVVPPEAESWSRLVNLPVPPQDYDAISLPPPDETAQVTSPAQFSYVRGKVQVMGTAAGENFSSYSLQLGQGINPERWLTVSGPATTPVEDGLLGEIDTSGMEGLYIVRLLVVQQDRLVKTGLLQVTVDNTPPEVSLPYPLHGQVFSGASQRTITLQAEARDAVGIQRVEWWVDGRKIGERTLAPFAWVWDAPAGSHLLQLRAFDLAGNAAQTEEIEIEVR